jgi:LysM repeat protein
MIRFFFNITIFLLISNLSFANADGGKNTRQEYIKRWEVTALKNMFEYNIPASITLAQGILESGNGNSTLTKKANNHFGIKCHGWAGRGYYMDDDKKDECFRVYDTPEESFEDHSQFLLKKRYANLFKLKTTDYKGWAKGLKKAGYATNPEYAKRLIRIIEDNKLYKFDKYSFSDYLDLKKKSKYHQEDEVEAITKKTSKKKRAIAQLDDDQNIEYIKGRRIIKQNNIQCIQAKDGDDYKKIAQDMNLGRWQILKYNDLKKTDKITKGEIIYIQPKKSKSKTKTHIAKNGDTYWSISQQYGIKLSKLLKKNTVQNANQGIKKGDKIRLR